MDLSMEHIREGKKMVKRALGKKDFQKYPGNALEICRLIVEDCWNGTYFQTSTGHFTSFYMRDFSFAVEGLLSLGYRHQVLATIQWALDIYEKNDTLSTTITPEGKPLHVFHYATDTLPLLMRAIRVARSKYIALQYSDFLNKQIRYYYKNVLDKEKGVVYENKTFSSMRDHYDRKSSMYDNSMMAMLPIEIEKLRAMGVRLVNPFNRWNFQKVLRDRFWAGTHFFDDLTLDSHISTDANVFPFYCGIFKNKQMIWDAMTMIQKYELDKPIPAKYTKEQHKQKEMFPVNLLAPNYEGNTCWTMLGLLYLYVVGEVSMHLLHSYLDVFTEKIEEQKNFLELFTAEGKPYKTTFYKSDEGMIWAAMYLDLMNR